MDRSLLKNRAKTVLKRDYMNILIAVVVVSLLSLNFISTGQTYDQFGNFYSTITIFNLEFVFAWAMPIGALLLVYTFLVGAVLDYGLRNHLKYKSLNNGIEFDYFDGFKNNYVNIVITNFMVGLRISLWGLLFIIPGLIKAYEYSYVNEILEEHPDWDYKQVLKESSRLTYGYKWELFVLDLSFFLWNLGFAFLAIFTFGLAAYLLIPYPKVTIEEAYLWLKEAKNLVSVDSVDYLQNTFESVV